jgi:alpha 1,2-mannosyltransferase
MYHFTGELEDKELRAELEASYDLKLVEVSGKRPNGKSWSECLHSSLDTECWQVDIKNSAFLHTQFTEFIYMDSVSYPFLLYTEIANLKDNIPLADPAELFDSIEYKQSGSVFWADLNKDHRMSFSTIPNL